MSVVRGERSGEWGMCLQEPLPGIPESVGPPLQHRPATDPGNRWPGDVGAASRVPATAPPLRLARRPLQARPRRGVLTHAILTGRTTWSTWRGWRAGSTPSPSWTWASSWPSCAAARCRCPSAVHGTLTPSMPGCVPRYRHRVPRVTMDIQDCLITTYNIRQSTTFILLHNYSVSIHMVKRIMLTLIYQYLLKVS